MSVYHGSTLIVDKPSIGFSKRLLDFGVDFYPKIPEIYTHIGSVLVTV